MARRVQDSGNRRTLLDELEEEIEHLKVAYDRYFYGVDKIPPVRKHEAVDRMIRNLLRNPQQSTQLRFRFNTLKARLNTYNQYWQRIIRQIEAGTYKRVLAESERREFLHRQRKAEERAAKLRGEDPEAQAGESAGEADAAKKPVRRPRAQPQRAELPPGMNAKEARELFKNFVQAKRAAGENTSGITYGALVKKLARDVPKLRQRYAAVSDQTKGTLDPILAKAGCLDWLAPQPSS